VLYWCFAAALFLAETIWRKNLIRSLMQAQMQLPEAIWQQMSHAWAGFFALLGILNLYVAFNFTTATWVNFKLFGTTGLMLVFVVLQSVYLSRHMEKDE
jgi:intracellular septation protein